jgi:hypothetical protein
MERLTFECAACGDFVMIDSMHYMLGEISEICQWCFEEDEVDVWEDEDA